MTSDHGTTPTVMYEQSSMTEAGLGERAHFLKEAGHHQTTTLWHHSHASKIALANKSAHIVTT